MPPRSKRSRGGWKTSRHLRIAIALDETRAQRISKVKCIRDGDRFVIQVSGVEETFPRAACLTANRKSVRRSFSEKMSCSVVPGPARGMQVRPLALYLAEADHEISSSVFNRPARSVPSSTPEINSRLSPCRASICSSMVSLATSR